MVESSQGWKELMSPDTLELIICFLESKYRMVMELVCIDLRMACLAVEGREFYQLFDQLNDEELILKALNEEPVNEEEIYNFEKRMPGFKLDFYMRELLRRTNGRMDWHDSLFHPVNIIAPIEEWTKDIGYLYFNNKKPILSALQISDFNFVHDCLVCIGSASQKLCWGTSSQDMEYNPFHVRTRKLYADKNFNLFELEYKGFEDYTFKKLGNLKMWFNSLIPQQKLSLKIVTKREPIRFAAREKQSDPDFVLKYLKTNGSQLKYVSKQLRSNKEIVLTAVSNYLDAVQYASDELKNDEMFMKEILLMHPLTIRFCSERVKRTDIALEAIKSTTTKSEELSSLSPLEFIPKSHSYNKEFALNMIQKTCVAYMSLSENLKGDRDICLEAVRNGLCISKIAPAYIDDKEIVLASLKTDPSQYVHVSERLRKDRDVILLVFQTVKYNLSFVPLEVGNDKNLMLEAVSANNACVVFDFLSDRLKADKEIALKFLSYRGEIYKHLPDSLKSDIDVLTTFLKTMTAHFSEDLKVIPIQILHDFCKEYDKALMLVAAFPVSFKFISSELRSNKKFILEVLESYKNRSFNKIDINHIGKYLLNDEEVQMRIADKKLGEELMKALPSDHKLSDKMIQHLVKTNPMCLKFFDQTPELIKLALKHSVSVVPPIFSVIQENKLTLEIVMYALKDNLGRWNDVPNYFKNRENTVEILKVYPKIYSQLSFSNRKDEEYIKIAIQEAINFKEIPPICLTTEIVIEALQKNNPEKVTTLIYPHLGIHFYEDKEVNKLLKEKVLL